MERRNKKKLINLPRDTVLLSQDESRFSSEVARVTSWSKSGSSVVYSGERYGTSLNCFGSLDLKTGNFISSFHDKGDAKATIEHFKKVRVSYDKKIPLAFLIDNASWHKTKDVQDYCKKNKITLFFLPPYSPEFNPIERVWSFLKSKMRQRYFKTPKIFKSFVFDFFATLNKTYASKLAKQCINLIDSQV